MGRFQATEAHHEQEELGKAARFFEDIEWQEVQAKRVRLVLEHLASADNRQVPQLALSMVAIPNCDVRGRCKHGLLWRNCCCY